MRASRVGEASHPGPRSDTHRSSQHQRSRRVPEDVLDALQFDLTQDDSDSNAQVNQRRHSPPHIQQGLAAVGKSQMSTVPPLHKPFPLKLVPPPGLTNAVEHTFIQKKFSSTDTFIQKRFHPMTLSSKTLSSNFDTFIQTQFHPMNIHPRTFSSNEFLIQ